jgi:endoglucanase
MKTPAKILDSNNQQVRISGLNWYGFETTDAVAHGLSSADYQAILKNIQSLGYNTIRIPFSNQVIETPTASSSLNISYWNNFGPINTQLQGLNSLQVLDEIVRYATSIGLKIILDNHRSEAGNSAESNGLWYTSAYPESNWINDWTMLAGRYLNNPGVIGFDLRNEPHNAYSNGSCWDCGSSTNDWHLAAERAGNAVLGVNPHLLLFVEGTDAYNNDYYWWGGNLEGVANSPVVLAVPNQLVYSAHDYGPTEYAQSWFNNDSAASLAGVWSQHWAYIDQQGIAPVWLGEFGTTNTTTDEQSNTSGSEGLWFQSLIGFLHNESTLNWTYWAMNGEDNYGLLDSKYDPTPVNPVKQSMLASNQFALSAAPASTISPATALTAVSSTTPNTYQINLSWTASATSGATYTVNYGTNPGSISTVAASGLTATSFPATNLNPATTYYFTVTAVASGASSAPTSPASATTQSPPAPGAPSGLSATASSATQINLSWTASSTSGATYNVYNGNTVIASGLSGTTYQNTGLTPSTQYTYTVTATANSVSSAASNSASATTQSAPAPNAPTNLTAAAVSSTQINLNWTASTTSGVTYDVYTVSSGGASNMLLANGLSGTSYQSNGLTASTQYTYVVTAVANSVASAASNAASATTQAAAVTAAPTNLTATPVSSTQINLSWTASTTANSTYTVYSGSSVLASGINGTSYQAAGLTASTQYTYTVTATANSVVSAASSSATATTQAPPVTAAPTSLSATAVSSSQINLSWTASTTANVTYTVYSGGNILASGIAGTSYQATGLTASTQYTYTVTATSNSVVSTASNSATATTQAPPVTAAPTSLTATAVSASQINLNWTASTTSNVTYTVYSGSSVLASGVSGTSFQSTGLSASTQYTYSVTATANSVVSAASNPASATTQAAATPTPSAPNGISASPFSASQINITWAASQNQPAISGITYSVYIGTSASNVTALLASNLTATSASATGLSDGTTYYFAVKAMANGVSSASSSVTSATTQTAPATPPTGVVASTSSATEIDLKWTAVPNTGATYSVYSGSNSGSTNTLVASGITGTAYAVTGLTASTTYYFTVRSVSPGGTSSPSAQVSATTQAISTPVGTGPTSPTPTAPTTPTLTATASSTTQVNLTWSAATATGTTSAITYTLYTGSSANSVTSVLATNLSGTAFSVPNLAPASTTYYTVTATNSVGTSAISNVASATTQSAPPAAPTNLTATATSSTAINLSWAASSGSGITYSVFNGSGSVLVSGLTTTSYAVTNLTASTAYSFTVKANNSVGTSPASNTASATTQAAAPFACHIAYTDYTDYQTGFTIGITISYTGPQPLTAWSLTWTYAGNQQIVQNWSSNYTQTGQQVTLTNAAWNGDIASGTTLAGPGFNAAYSGTNTDPTVFYLNGHLCQ